MKLVFAAILPIALTACGQASNNPAPRDGAPLDAVRVDMLVGQPARAAPSKGATPGWAALGDGTSADFGYPGQVPLLSVRCRSGVLTVTRNAPADAGAQALFALIGNGRIVRLPVDATSVPGTRGYVWQGSIAPGDPASEVFLGGSIEGTLPGAGRITISGGAVPRQVLSGCRGKPATAAPSEAVEAE